MTTPSAVAVPSRLPADLLFNAGKLDEAVNSSALSYLDRFGISRRTVAGAINSIAAVNTRGAWAASTAYAQKDTVLFSGTWYICLLPHTSSGSFVGDAINWRIYQGVTADRLAANDGAAQLGVRQAGTGAGDRTVEDEVREVFKISQFYGGGANDTTAFARAFAAITAGGASSGRCGLILLPARFSPYLLDAQMLADLGSGTNSVSIAGESWATKLQVASPCSEFLQMQGAWSELRDFQILDPNNYCSQAYIKTKPASGAPSLIRRVSRVSIIGAGNSSDADGLVNDGGQQLRIQDVSVQNTRGAFWNQGGGVDSFVDRLYCQGTQYGVRLHGNVTYGHAENLTINESTLLCTQSGAVGIEIKDALAVSFINTTSAQLGSGGIGLSIDGVSTPGSYLTKLYDCHIEGSDTGAAIKSRGNNTNFVMIGGSFGQGGWSPSLIRCIDMNAVNGFLFEATTAIFLSNCNKLAAFEDSIGIVGASNRGWGVANNASTEVNCDIRWMLREGEGLPAVRSPTSEYPNGAWVPFAPSVSSGAGAITTVGAVDCTWRKSGKTLDLRISVAITTNGSGAGTVFVPLPFTLKTGKVFVLPGRENGLTPSAMLQGVASGNGVSIFKAADGSYPAANGSVLIVNGTVELA